MLLAELITTGIGWVRGEEGQVGMGDHREGDVPIPGGVLTDLVVVEADLVLGRLEHLLNAPPGSRDPDQLGRSDRTRGITAVERQVSGVR
jgi:hypothetical protein